MSKVGTKKRRISIVSDDSLRVFRQATAIAVKYRAMCQNKN